jgi:hypothetical protein
VRLVREARNAAAAKLRWDGHLSLVRLSGDSSSQPTSAPHLDPTVRELRTVSEDCGVLGQRTGLCHLLPPHARCKREMSRLWAEPSDRSAAASGFGALC